MDWLEAVTHFTNAITVKGLESFGLWQLQNLNMGSNTLDDSEGAQDDLTSSWFD